MELTKLNKYLKKKKNVKTDIRTSANGRIFRSSGNTVFDTFSDTWYLKQTFKKT